MQAFRTQKRAGVISGFTLIELLVVIAIIALLSSVILSSLNSARAKARDTQRLESLIQVRNAIFLYQSDHDGGYPPLGNTGTGDWPVAVKSALSSYMPGLPIDPTSNEAGPSIWRYLGFNHCDPTGASCAWFNSPQVGTACPGQYVLYAYNTEGIVHHQECAVNNPKVMTVIVGT